MKSKRKQQTSTPTMATSTPPQEAGTPQSSTPQPIVPSSAEAKQQEASGPCSNVPLSTEEKRFEVRYELLFSETRLPNFVQSSPRHTITLASSKTAMVIHLRNEESRRATELGIRNGTMRFVELSRDIMAIETFDHALGWPFCEHAHSRLFTSLAPIEEADIPILLLEHNPYGIPFGHDAISVLTQGPMKAVKSLLFDRHDDSVLTAPKALCVFTYRPDSLYSSLCAYLQDEESSQLLRERVDNGGNIVLVPNTVVKAILLLPREDLGGSVVGYGLDNMPKKVVARLTKFGLQQLPSGVWTKQKWTGDDEDILVNILAHVARGHFAEPEMGEG
jgi:hypothetical protein